MSGRSLAHRLHRRLVRLLHPDLTSEAAEIEGVFSTRLAAAADRGIGAMTRVMLIEVFDLLRSSPRLRPNGAGLGLDARLAARGLLKARGFSILAVATLGVALGSAAAVMHAGRGFRSATLPYPAAERMVRLDAQTISGEQRGEAFRVVEWEALAAAASYELVAGSFPIEGTRLEDGQASRVDGLMVTPGFFELFGAQFQAGRGFQMSDDPNAPVVVLSHSAWQGWLGSDPGPIGRAINIDGRNLEVVGVIGPDFAPPEQGDFYIHHGLGTEGWIGRWLSIHARLSRGAAVERAFDESAAAMAAIDQDRTVGWEAAVTPLLASIIAPVLPTLRLLLTAVLVLLGLAVANVAALLMTRTVQRRGILALRVALGSAPGRAGSVAIVEGLLLAAMAAVTGCLIAWAFLSVLGTLAPPSLPFSDALQPRPDVFLLVIGVSLAVGVLAGLPAALMGRRMGLGGARAGLGDRMARDPAVLSGAMVVQTALALVVIGTTGLILRSVDRLVSSDIGFTDSGQVAFALDFPADRYPGAEEIASGEQTLKERLLANPAVTAVGLGTSAPLTGSGPWSRAYSEALVAEAASGPAVLTRVARRDYFEVLGTTLVAGRLMDATDGPDAPPTVVISRSLAEGLWPGESAVGKRLSQRRAPADEDWFEVIGVVSDVRFEGIAEVGRPQIYLPMDQDPTRQPVLVVAGPDADRVSEIVRATVLEFDPRIPVKPLGSLAELKSREMAPFTFAATTLSGFALLALLLVTAGVYGTASLVVAARVRESGIRLALGASRARVLVSVVQRALRWTLVGLPVGAALAWTATSSLGRMIPGMGAGDPVTWVGAGLLLLGLAALAALIPGVRAASADPGMTLRSD